MAADLSSITTLDPQLQAVIKLSMQDSAFYKQFACTFLEFIYSHAHLSPKIKKTASSTTQKLVNLFLNANQEPYYRLAINLTSKALDYLDHAAWSGTYQSCLFSMPPDWQKLSIDRPEHASLLKIAGVLYATSMSEGPSILSSPTLPAERLKKINHILCELIHTLPFPVVFHYFPRLLTPPNLTPAKKNLFVGICLFAALENRSPDTLNSQEIQRTVHTLDKCQELFNHIGEDANDLRLAWQKYKKTVIEFYCKTQETSLVLQAMRLYMAHAGSAQEKIDLLVPITELICSIDRKLLTDELRQAFQNLLEHVLDLSPGSERVMWLLLLNLSRSKNLFFQKLALHGMESLSVNSKRAPESKSSPLFHKRSEPAAILDLLAQEFYRDEQFGQLPRIAHIAANNLDEHGQSKMHASLVVICLDFFKHIQALSSIDELSESAVETFAEAFYAIIVCLQTLKNQRVEFLLEGATSLHHFVGGLSATNNTLNLAYASNLALLAEHADLFCVTRAISSDESGMKQLSLLRNLRSCMHNTLSQKFFPLHDKGESLDKTAYSRGLKHALCLAECFDYARKEHFLELSDTYQRIWMSCHVLMLQGSSNEPFAQFSAFTASLLATLSFPAAKELIFNLLEKIIGETAYYPLVHALIFNLSHALLEQGVKASQLPEKIAAVLIKENFDSLKKYWGKEYYLDCSKALAYCERAKKTNAESLRKSVLWLCKTLPLKSELLFSHAPNKALFGPTNAFQLLDIYAESLQALHGHNPSSEAFKKGRITLLNLWSAIYNFYGAWLSEPVNKDFQELVKTSKEKILKLGSP